MTRLDRVLVGVAIFLASAEMVLISYWYFMLNPLP